VLTKPFFSLCQALQEARGFGDVADLLSNRLPPLIGAADASIMVLKLPEQVEAIYGHGPVAELMRERLELVNELAPTHPAMAHIDFSNPGELGVAVSDHLGPDEYRECEFNRRIKTEFPTEDAIFGRLTSTCARRTVLMACREKGTFTTRERQLFDVILYTARAVLERIASGSLERQVVQYLLSSKSDAPNCFFLLQQNGEVVPLNHDAVQLAERWWGEDQPMLALDEEVRRRLWNELDAAWDDPITGHFKRVRIDLGGGPMTLFVVVKIDGSMVMVLPLRRQGKDSDLDSPGEEQLAAVLTRRQREIMEWIAEGKTSAEVAIILDISPRTVEKHLEAVFHRLGVENRIAAVRRFLDLKSGQPV